MVTFSQNDLAEVVSTSVSGFRNIPGYNSAVYGVIFAIFVGVHAAMAPIT